MFAKKFDWFTIICNTCKRSVSLTADERGHYDSTETYIADDYQITISCGDCKIEETVLASELDL